MEHDDTVIEGLRRARPDLTWEHYREGFYLGAGDERKFYQHTMVLVDGDLHLNAAFTMPDSVAEREHVLGRVVHGLERMAEDRRLPTCITPGCEEKGRAEFRAAEAGRLGGRTWQPGDSIRVCPRHGDDIWRALYATGNLDELAEWLRVDARPRGLDAYDAEADTFHGREIEARTSRVLLMARVPQT